MSVRLSDEAIAFARFVRGTDGDELRAVLASRRDEVVDRLFAVMASIQPPRDADGVVEWRIGGRQDGGADRIQTTLGNDAIEVARDGDGEPALVVTIDALDLLRIAARAASASAVLSHGGLRLEGDLKLAIRLDTWFRRLTTLIDKIAESRDGRAAGELPVANDRPVS